VTTRTVAASADLTVTFRAMATDVTVRVVRPTAQAEAAVSRAVGVFRRVEAACTRFDPTSPLMVANATPRDWHVVPAECFDAIAEAARAHRETDGRFDPRVLRILEAWGYDRSLPFKDGPVSLDGPLPPDPRRPRGRAGEGISARRPPRPWRPGLDPARRAVRLGAHPIDLGGIGKGLAVRWAAAQLQGAGVAARGVHGRPTLLHNVETLARVGLAARTGASGYRPTTLLTVVAGGRRTVIEVDPATTLAGSVEAAGATAWPEPQAVLVGGYGGSWLPWVSAAGLPANEPALRAAGASLGAGVVAPLPADVCGLAETARIVGYLAASSARQCGPCLFGLPPIADLLHALAAGVAGRSDLRRLRRYLGEVDGRGACHHPDGAVRLVSSALRTFGAEVTAHVRGRACDAAARTGVLPIPAVG